jgi:RNA polymerase sigma factor (sigma-70 family)
MTAPDLSSLTAALAADVDAAFPDYVKLTADGVFGGALRMLGNRADAEDIMQDTYARAYRALREYPQARIRDLQVRGWTWTIAANLCRNRLRSRARKPAASLEGIDPPAGDASIEDAGMPEIDGHLQSLLLQLPFPQRAAIVMRHVLDLSYDEVATALNRPVGTIKSDVNRGLARLRQAYPQEVIR